MTSVDLTKGICHYLELLKGKKAAEQENLLLCSRVDYYFTEMVTEIQLTLMQRDSESLLFSVVTRSAALTSPGSLFKLQTLRPHPQLMEYEPPLQQDSQVRHIHLTLRNTGPSDLFRFLLLEDLMSLPQLRSSTAPQQWGTWLLMTSDSLWQIPKRPHSVGVCCVFRRTAAAIPLRRVSLRPIKDSQSEKRDRQSTGLCRSWLFSQSWGPPAYHHVHSSGATDGRQCPASQLMKNQKATHIFFPRRSCKRHFINYS